MVLVIIGASSVQFGLGGSEQKGHPSRTSTLGRMGEIFVTSQAQALKHAR